MPTTPATCHTNRHGRTPGFDPGPPADLARLLLGGEPGFEWPVFGTLGVTAHPSFGVGPVYRGRFRQLSLVVVADQTSEDDLFKRARTLR